jgi:hypothetical protein
LAKNDLIKEKTAQDIDGRIERVLGGLGNPEPPLRLEEVRELLKLDRVFYTALCRVVAKPRGGLTAERAASVFA